MGQRNYTQDAELVLSDGAAAYTADGVGQVGGADAIITAGAGRFEGVVVIDVDAIDIANSDELYNVCVIGSAAADLSTGREILAMLALGDTAVRPAGAINSTIGRYELPFNSEQDDVKYPYIGIFVDVAGTSPSIDFRAYAAVKY